MEAKPQTDQQRTFEAQRRRVATFNGYASRWESLKNTLRQLLGGEKKEPEPFAVFEHENDPQTAEVLAATTFGVGTTAMYQGFKFDGNGRIIRVAVIKELVDEWTEDRLSDISPYLVESFKQLGGSISATATYRGKVRAEYTVLMRDEEGKFKIIRRDQDSSRFAKWQNLFQPAQDRLSQISAR